MENEVANDKTMQKHALQASGLSPAEVAIQAISMGYGKEALEVLKGISELQLKHDAEDAKKEYATAMSECQAEIPIIIERGRNQQTGNSPYAKLKDLVAGARPVYTKYGFSISFYQEDSPKENHVRWCADVMHKAGHMAQRHVDVPIDDKGIKGNPNKTATHAMKSSSTYGRGILIAHIFNIPTGDDIDDDGNGAGGNVYLSEEQQTFINNEVESVYGQKAYLFWKYMGVESADQITVDRYKMATYAIEKAKQGSKK
jgi:hypothetical protein